MFTSPMNDLIAAQEGQSQIYSAMQNLLSKYSSIQSGASTGDTVADLQASIFKTSMQAQMNKTQKNLAENFVQEELADQKKTINLLA